MHNLTILCSLKNFFVYLRIFYVFSYSLWFVCCNNVHNNVKDELRYSFPPVFSLFSHLLHHSLVSRVDSILIYILFLNQLSIFNQYCCYTVINLCRLAVCFIFGINEPCGR